MHIGLAPLHTASNIQAQELDRHGLMTRLILKALHGEETDVLDEEGHIDIRGLHAYLQKKMPKEQLPDLSGKFGPYSCILASHPKLSPRLRREADRVREDTLMTAISKLQNQITDSNFFKRLAEANTRFHVQQFDLAICEAASVIDLNQGRFSDFLQRDRVQIQDDFSR